MSIVKSKNKKTGITYVYSSESYWDPVKKQPRNHRKLIGKLDDNGNIVPTGSRGRKRKEEPKSDPSEQKLRDELESSLSYYQERCMELETQVALLEEQNRKLEKEKTAVLAGMKGLLEKYQ